MLLHWKLCKISGDPEKFSLKFSAPVSGKKSTNAPKAGGREGSVCAPAIWNDSLLGISVASLVVKTLTPLSRCNRPTCNHTDAHRAISWLPSYIQHIKIYMNTAVGLLWSPAGFSTFIMPLSSTVPVNWQHIDMSALGDQYLRSEKQVTDLATSTQIVHCSSPEAPNSAVLPGRCFPQHCPSGIRRSRNQPCVPQPNTKLQLLSSLRDSSVKSLLVPAREEVRLATPKSYLSDFPMQSAPFLPSTFKCLAVSLPDVEHSCL